MKNSKVICLLASLLSMLGSPRVSYGDLKTGLIGITNLKKENSNKPVENQKSETKKLEDKSNIKKKKNDVKVDSKLRSFWDKSKPIIKKAAPYISAFLGGMGTLYGYQTIFGDQNKKDDNPNEEFHYVDGLIQIPDEMYNINEKYQPNNSGLSDYTGSQASHEGHLKWQSYNCWVLANLYLYFRPELKSTYEEYASKPIKDIIYELDNLPGNDFCTIFDAYVFF